MSLRRTFIGSSTAVGVAIAVAGATAFACIAPARINLSSAAGRPGDVITITGGAFVPSGTSTNPVMVRWGSADGPVLAEALPDREGNFTTTFTVPDAAPGYYTILGVLLDADGKDAPGTPGRALFEVRDPAAAAVPGPQFATPEQPVFTPATTDGGASFPLTLVIGLGVLGLVLFAGGLIAFTRGRRGGVAKAEPAAVRRRD